MGKDDLPLMLIKYKGVFDFDNLFKSIYEWLREHRYTTIDEKIFKHKIPNPKGAEQEIVWVASQRVTHYIKFHMDIKFKIMDLKDVEIVKGDKKQMKSFGKIRIMITPTIETDYNKRFSKYPFLDKLFNKFIYKNDSGILYWDRLYYRSYQLHQKIKSLLDMETEYNAFDRRW